MMAPERKSFIEFLIAQSVLRFGEFKTKAGRQSPYFFNTGLISDGEGLLRLAQAYAQTLLAYEAAHPIRFDGLFGPAYKGITLAAAVSIALAQKGRNIPFTYNRKEAKDHGEGGVLVGAPLKGRIVIVDDVISAGTSVRESIQMIRSAGAQPAAVLICMDRMERGGNADQPSELSAVQEVQHEFGIPVLANLTLTDLLSYLSESSDGELSSTYRDKVAAYQARYGVA